MAHDSTAGLPCLPLPVAQEYDRPLSFDPLGSTDRPRPGLCPQTSGPVRDPARTAPNRADLRIVRVPLTCLAPSPLSSNFRDLTPFPVRPSVPAPTLADRPEPRRSPCPVCQNPFPEACDLRPQTPVHGAPAERGTRLPLGLLPNPSVVPSFPVGTVPGIFTASPAWGF